MVLPTSLPTTPVALPRRPSLGLRTVMACVRREEREEHGESFEVVRESPRAMDGSRPLVIVVHPGDAVETPLGWRPVDRIKVLEVSRQAQAGMAHELEEARRAGSDAVVIHRRSSDLVLQDQNAAWQNPAYRHEVQQLGRRGALLYGDDLESAAAWIAGHAALASRPRVLLTGAYSERDHGCVSAVGQALQVRFPHVPFELSPWSPTSSSNDDPRWDPRPAQPPVAPVRSPADLALVLDHRQEVSSPTTGGPSPARTVRRP